MLGNLRGFRILFNHQTIWQIYKKFGVRLSRVFKASTLGSKLVIAVNSKLLVVVHHESRRSFSHRASRVKSRHLHLARLERLTRFLSAAFFPREANSSRRALLPPSLTSWFSVRDYSRTEKSEESHGHDRRKNARGMGRGRTRFPSRSRLPRSGLNTPASLTLIEYSAIALRHPRRNPQKERRVGSALSSFSFLRKRTNPARFLSENLADSFDATREITCICISEIKRNIVIRSRHIMYMSSREGPRVG